MPRMTEFVRLRSINAKLILTFLVALAPMYLVSLQLNRMGSDSVMQQVKDSMNSRVNYYLTSLQTAVDGITRLQRQYVIDEDIQKLSNIAPSMSSFERAMAQRRVQDKMMLMTISSPYVAESRIYIPMIGKTILSASDEGAMSESEVEDAKRTALAQPKPLVQIGDRLVVQYVSPNPQVSQDKTSFIMQIDISAKHIVEELEQLANVQESGAALISRSQSWTVSTMGEDGLGDRAVAFVNARYDAGERSGEGRMSYAGQRYLVAYAYSEALKSSLLLTLPEDEAIGPLNRYRDWFWLLSGLSLLTVILFSSSIYRVIHKPIRSMVFAFRKLERGDMGTRIHMRRQDEFQYLYTQFNITVDRLKSLIEEVYESRITLQRSELKQLQSQINPHFLYNTYFLVHRMAKAMKVDEVIRATEYLGVYFQHITRNASEFVPLEQEYRHIVAYIELQSLRFHHRIKPSFEPLPEALAAVSVPRLLLQPMVENAYQHGLKEKLEGGILRISVSERSERSEAREDRHTEKTISFVVEDNGDELSDAALDALRSSLAERHSDQETTGLLNVHLRVRLRYGSHYGIILSRSALGGLRVELSLPLDGKKEGL
ncbi:histidine kinase [Cohnella sp. GCM10020058]|uniref:sensor histidine kinase n=1 Tax=Cohnella sp. GCM10020058 TaxID=3317330 RepID=UPI003634C3EE